MRKTLRIVSVAFPSLWLATLTHVVHGFFRTRPWSTVQLMLWDSSGSNPINPSLAWSASLKEKKVGNEDTTVCGGLQGVNVKTIVLIIDIHCITMIYMYTMYTVYSRVTYNLWFLTMEHHPLGITLLSVRTISPEGTLTPLGYIVLRIR